MRARFATRLAAVTLATAAAAPARSQTVVTDAGTAFVATALTGFATTGSEMGGLHARARFANGGTSDAIWSDLGGGVWGAENLAFSLRLGGASDTFSSPWQLLDLSGVGIVGLELNAAPGKTVFDILASPEVTPGSAAGRQIEIVGGDVFGTTATYRNWVGIGAVLPLGDLYETLDIAFQKVIGPNGVQFIADTDNVGARGTVTSTPEPATFALMALGAAAILGLEWRRRQPA
jgi:hypothetical protein